jgi:hypothetical protein
MFPDACDKDCQELALRCHFTVKPTSPGLATTDPPAQRYTEPAVTSTGALFSYAQSRKAKDRVFTHELARRGLVDREQLLANGPNRPHNPASRRR